MQKGFVPILLLVGILVMVAVAGGAYYFGKLPIKPAGNNQKACSQEANICPDGSFVGRAGPNCAFTPCPSVSPKPDGTFNWTTYTSTQYRYSFSYPSSWTVVDAKGSGAITEIHSWNTGDGLDGRSIKTSEIKIEIYEIDNPEKLTIRQWYTTDKAQRDKLLKEEDITVNGMLGVKRLWDAGDYQYISVDLAKGDNIYRVLGIPIKTYLNEFNQILSTFKFLP